ncbi:MAG: iron-containing alcohol dehydrogenase, partial [Butyricicoccaceae bacterium]
MSIGVHAYWPKKVVTGAGAALNIAEYAKDYAGSKIILFTDKGLVDLEKTKDVISKLEDAGYSVDVYCDLEANPTDITVHKAADYLAETKPDIMVCYGGGSAIDTGKAANVVYTHGGKVHEYEDLAGGVAKIKDKLLPCIAIATTAGTGSEVSSCSVITDTTRWLKICLMSPYMVPDVSILDPEVTVSLPASLTAYTGMDALTHCIEAYVSSVDFEPGRGFAIQGIKCISRSLRKAVLEGDN